MKVGWLAPLGIRVPGMGSCSKLLEDLVPRKYEELLQESFADIAQ